MENLKNLGRILVSNLVLNTPGLASYLHKSNMEPKRETVDKGFTMEGTFGDDIKSSLKRFYNSSTLYSQLLFSKNPEKIPFVGKMPSYINAMKKYQQGETGARLCDYWFLRNQTEEAFRRSCLQNHVEPCDVVYGFNFPYSYLLDFANGNAIINSRINYFNSRSTFLIETINSMSVDYKNFQNIFKIIEDPQSLSDKDFFVAVTNAMDLYLFSEIKNHPKISDKNIKTFSIWEQHFPNAIDRDLAGFYQTRKQLQAGKLYGLEIRDELRAREEEYYDYLVRGGIEQSLVASENLLGAFIGSPLDNSSNGQLGNMARQIFDESANSFYSLIGADMEEGETFGEYVEWVENVFDEEDYSRDNIKSNPVLNIFENNIPPEGDIFDINGEKIISSQDESMEQTDFF